ncbi:Uncharacterised protein [Chlamydia trachomatis]|nr:Uncharacterised protein [Chlamydia trachomatis]
MRNVNACKTNEDCVHDDKQRRVERCNHALVRRRINGEARADGTGREMQDVEDEEEQDQNAGHAHGARGVRIGNGLLHDVAGRTCATRTLPRVCSCVQMDDKHQEHRGAEDPDESAVREDRHESLFLQPMCVMVIRFLTEEHLEVAVGVEQQEEDENEARDGHQLLNKNTGGPRAALLRCDICSGHVPRISTRLRAF